MNSEIFIFIGLFASVAFIAYLYFNSRHKERMALIESGKDAGLFKQSSNPQYMGALKWGLMLVSLGIGAGLGSSIDLYRHHDGPFVTLPLLLASGGIGLLIYYYIARNQELED